MTFDKFVHSGNLNQSLDIEHFHNPKVPGTPLPTILLFLPPAPGKH